MKTQRTRSQERVLDFLRTSSQAISAQDLHLELRCRGEGMGLATVYRSLEALKLAGIVQGRLQVNGETLYSLTQQDQHYLTCLQCGTSIAISACPVQELEVQLRQSQKFEIYYHTLEFFGLCHPCQTAVTQATDLDGL